MKIDMWDVLLTAGAWYCGVKLADNLLEKKEKQFDEYVENKKLRIEIEELKKKMQNA